MPASADTLAAADLLRVATAGHVDDGKSTLIGRLLVDTRQVLEDQLDALERSRRERGRDEIDLAHLTDGLRAERERGITIDVAYRYFATAHRRFILADTPGHVEYTRNMVTGASTADVSVVLVDASRGLAEQTRRHTAISALLHVPRIVLCVNKMDLVGYDETRFAALADEWVRFARELGAAATHAVPISALRGDNVVERSPRMPWYAGPPLLELLENVPPERRDAGGVRLPVQTIVRGDATAFVAGRVERGTLYPGDELAVVPGGVRVRVRSVRVGHDELDGAAAPRSITVALDGAGDLRRGDLLADPDDAPAPRTELAARVCWLHEAGVRPGAVYALKHTTRWTRARVTSIPSRLDVTTLAGHPDPGALGLNDLAEVRLALEAPVAADPYAACRATGSFVLVDEDSHATVAAGMVL